MNAVRITRLASAAAALAASTVLLAGPAQAQQSEDRALSRAEVNEQTLAAIKSGTMLRAGEGQPQGPESVVASGKTREARKAETMQARRNGEIQPLGLGLYKTNMSQQTAVAHSTKTRAERKAETMQAIKEHKTLPAGEAA